VHAALLAALRWPATPPEPPTPGDA
jgi:hypothetical protein